MHWRSALPVWPDGPAASIVTCAAATRWAMKRNSTLSGNPRPEGRCFCPRPCPPSGDRYSLTILKETLTDLPHGPISTQTNKQAAADALIISLVEGWRGRIAHLGLTGRDGKLRRYKVIDPSFFNWSGLAMALRNEQISDFPLCNKSFNLSYCGVDL